MTMTQTTAPATGSPSPAPPAAQKDGRTSERTLTLRMLARPEVGVFLGAAAVYVFFLIAAPPVRDASSMANILYGSSTIGIMALPVALLMIGGKFDLSAGVAVITSALTAAMLSYQLTMNVWVGVIAALVVSLGIGFLNGWLVVKTGLPSFLVTLGSFLILQGVNLAVTKLVTGNVATDDISTMDGFDQAKKVFASSFDIGGVQVKITIFWWLLFAAIATWVLLRTKYGNWVFAVGGNKEAARLSGIAVKQYALVAMGICAACAALGGMVAAANLGSGRPQGVGETYLLNAFVAVFIGASTLRPGRFHVLGTAVGVLLIGVINNGLSILGVQTYWQYIVQGVLLILALISSSMVTVRRG